MANAMAKKNKTLRKTLPAGIGGVLKRLHYPLDVILLCVQWYVAYSLSLRNLEEMMAERGIGVDHSTVHRWAIKLRPVLEKALVQIVGPVEMHLITKDALPFEKESIPDGRRDGVPEPESGEVKLALADAMHQLDA
jgi:hypothetical protein